MLSEEIRRVAGTRIDLEFRERVEQFDYVVASLIEKSRQHGGLNSAGTVDVIAKAVSVECATRAMIAWEVLARVLNASPVTIDEHLAEELKAVVAEHLANGCDDLGRHRVRALSFISGGVMPSLEEIRS